MKLFKNVQQVENVRKVPEVSINNFPVLFEPFETLEPFEPVKPLEPLLTSVLFFFLNLNHEFLGTISRAYATADIG